MMTATYQSPSHLSVEKRGYSNAQPTIQQENLFRDVRLNTWGKNDGQRAAKGSSALIPFHEGLVNAEANSIQVAKNMVVLSQMLTKCYPQERTDDVFLRQKLDNLLAQLDAEFDADRDAGLLEPELLEKSLREVRAKRPYK